MIRAMYSIKAVSQATGLSVETLRAWERRYGLVTPARDGAGRRVYRSGDVLRLRRLREATDRGHPIGRIARFDDAQLAALLDGQANAPPRSGGSAFVERILAATQAFRSDECEQALTLAIAILRQSNWSAKCCGRCCRRSASAGTAANCRSHRSAWSRPPSASTYRWCSTLMTAVRVARR